MHVRACVSRPNGAAGCPPPPSPFHGHSEPTTRPRSQSTALVPSGEVAEPRPKVKDACVLVDGQGLVWARNGGTDRQPNSPRPTSPRPPRPHRRALPRFSSSLSRVSAATAHCPLPTAPSPVLFPQLWHPGRAQGWLVSCCANHRSQSQQKAALACWLAE
jgi:hypothetical protein